MDLAMVDSGISRRAMYYLRQSALIDRITTLRFAVVHYTISTSIGEHAFIDDAQFQAPKVENRRGRGRGRKGEISAPHHAGQYSTKVWTEGR